MVTYFNKKDMVSFGNFLLSQKRESNIVRGFYEKIKESGRESSTKDDDILDEVVGSVSHADFENWLEEQKRKHKTI